MFRIILVMFMVFGLTGCATPRNKKVADVGDLQARIATLEMQQEEQAARIEQLKGELELAQADSSAVSQKRYTGTSSSQAPSMTNKNVQRALKNAGYYGGAIDGKIGRMTQKAITDFQRDNGLKVDGVVGKKTWAQLATYM